MPEYPGKGDETFILLLLPIAKKGQNKNLKFEC